MINLPEIPEKIINTAKFFNAWIYFNPVEFKCIFYINAIDLSEDQKYNTTEFLPTNLDPKFKYSIVFQDILRNPNFNQYIYNPKLELILYKRESTSIPLQTTDPNQLSLF